MSRSMSRGNVGEELSLVEILELESKYIPMLGTQGIFHDMIRLCWVMKEDLRISRRKATGSESPIQSSASVERIEPQE